MEAADTSSSDRQHQQPPSPPQQKGEEDGTKKQHHQLVTADDKSGAEAEEKYRGWKAMPYVIGELSLFLFSSLHHHPLEERTSSIVFLQILPPSIIVILWLSSLFEIASFLD
jgi:hypothetical protein